MNVSMISKRALGREKHADQVARAAENARKRSDRHAEAAAAINYARFLAEDEVFRYENGLGMLGNPLPEWIP